MTRKVFSPPPAQFNQTALDGLSLDSVSGLTPSDNLSTDTTITFYIHVKNIDNTPRYAITNNFRIYSPDGAAWNQTIGDTIDFGWGYWGQMFDFTGFKIDYRHANGWGSDTVVFWGISNFGNMPGDFDETSYSLTIGPIDQSMDGKTICIDSCSFPPAGQWVWVDEYANSSIPPWHGPYCYTVEAMNTISYSGYLYYLDPHPPDTIPMPMRHIRIEMWDNDASPFPDDLLAIDTTTDMGYFELGPIENDDMSGNLDIYLKIYAENEAAYVTDDHNGDIHVIQTPEQPNLPSGEYDTTITASLIENGPFFIADAVLEVYDSWYYLTNSQAAPVEVVSNISDSTYFNSVDYYIRIAENQSNPNTYDKDIIFHEYAHYMEHIFAFFDHGGGTHEWDELVSPTLAASEGFATFLSCLFRNDCISRDFTYNFVDTFWVNLENGQKGKNTGISNSANNYGEVCEGSVAGILWDIYDDVDDDYSTYKMPPNPPPNGYDPDGIWDTLSNGSYNILNVVLLDRTVDGHHPDNIDEFWQAWFQSPSLGHATAIRHIWYEHGIPTCGDPNSDAEVSLADVLFLINYIFKGGPAPDKLETGDVDDYPEINVGDAVYLINYIFKGGPAPCGIQ